MGEKVSIRKFAKLENCSHTLVVQAVARGALFKDAGGKLDAADVGTGWCEGNRKKIAAAEEAALAGSDPPANNAPQGQLILGPDGLLSQANAEKLKENMSARLQEHKYREAIKAVVPVAAVAEIVGSKFAAVRTRLLAIPTEQAPRVHRCKTVAEVEGVLLEVVTEALEEIANGDVGGAIQAGA